MSDMHVKGKLESVEPYFDWCSFQKRTICFSGKVWQWPFEKLLATGQQTWIDVSRSETL